MAKGINADALSDAAKLVIDMVAEFKAANAAMAEAQAVADRANADLSAAKQRLETCRAKALKAKRAVAELGDESEVADAPVPAVAST